MRRFLSLAASPSSSSRRLIPPSSPPAKFWPRHAPAPSPTAARAPATSKEGRAAPAPSRRGSAKGVLKTLDPVVAGVSREISALQKPADVLAHHAEAMDDYDAVAAAAALGKVAGAGLGGAAGVAPWKRQPVGVRDVDTLARHTVELLRGELRGAAFGGAGGAPLPVRTLAGGLHALARLGRAPASLLHEVSYSLVSAAGGGQRGADASLAPADVAQLAFAYSRCNVRAPQLFNVLADAATREGLRGYRPADAAGLLLSFSALRTPAPALFAAGAATVVARREQVESVTPQVLANAALALARGGGQDEGADGAAERARAERRRARAAAAAVAAAEAQAVEPPPPPPPSQGATAAWALETLAPRMEAIARRYRVPGVQAGAFTASGAAQVCWAYARVLSAQRAWGVGEGGRLRAASAAAAVGAVGAAFTHPQTLATATPAQLATVAQAFASLHEAAGEEQRDALGTGAVLTAVARAAVRLLDPAASGREMAQRAEVAAEALRRVASTAGLGGASSGGGGGLMLPGSGGGGALGVPPAAAGAGGGDAGDDPAEAAAARDDWLAVEKMARAAAELDAAGGDAEEDVRVRANPAAPLRYSPLAYSKSLALATPFSTFDVAQLADAFCRVGHTAAPAGGGACEGGAALEECWVKLSERVARGVAARPVAAGAIPSSAREAARELREDSLRDASPAAAVALAAAFASGAPRAAAARVLTALALTFCEEDGAAAWVGGGGMVGALLRARGCGVRVCGGAPAAAPPASPGDGARPLLEAAAEARAHGWWLRDAPAPPVDGAASGAQHLLPSFDEDPDWLAPALDAARRATRFRKARGAPMHRLRGESAEGGRSALLEVGARGHVEEEDTPGGLLLGEAPLVAAGTGRSWAARVLYKCDPPTLARLAGALAAAFPVERAPSPLLGAGGEVDADTAAAGVGAEWARVAVARAAPRAWRARGGPLFAFAPPPVRLLRGHVDPASTPLQRADGLIVPAPLAHAAIAHTLAAVCGRLRELWGGAAHVGAAAELLPLLATRRYSGGGGGNGWPHGAPRALTVPPCWPPEALARRVAVALLEGHFGDGEGADARRARKLLPLPLAAYAALAPALGSVVSNALRQGSPHQRAQPHRGSLAVALASAAPARRALGAFARAVVERYRAAPLRGGDAARAAAVHALGTATAAALLPSVEWARGRGPSALGGDAAAAAAAEWMLPGGGVRNFAAAVAEEEVRRRAAGGAGGRSRGSEWAALDAAAGVAALCLSRRLQPHN